MSNTSDDAWLRRPEIEGELTDIEGKLKSLADGPAKVELEQKRDELLRELGSLAFKDND